MDVFSLSDDFRTVHLPDVEPVSLVSEDGGDQNAGQSRHPHPSPLPKGEGIRTRGVAWVVRWVAVMGMLAWAAAQVVAFGYQLAAEQTLARAARAGALEATLPRATAASIADVIWTRLDDWAIPRREMQITLTQNGTPLHQQFHPRPGDRVAVTLRVASVSVLPAWLRNVSIAASGRHITAHAVRELPGRSLPLTADL